MVISRPEIDDCKHKLISAAVNLTQELFCEKIFLHAKEELVKWIVSVLNCSLHFVGNDFPERKDPTIAW